MGLDSEGGCTNGLHARPPARHLGHQKRRSDWCLFPELQGGFGGILRQPGGGQRRRFQAVLEQMDTSYTKSGTGCWRQETEVCKKGWKYGPWGEDLFMQRTMDDAEVSKISDFSLTSSGTCPGDRPKDKKKDTKFVPTCTAGDT